MNLSTWAIRNPVPPIAMFLVLTLLGIVSFLQLPVTRFPNVDVPVINVTVVQPGAAPSDLVSSVTETIEDGLAEVTGVHSISSTVTDSRSVTTVQFDMEVAANVALADVNAAIGQLRGRLPEGITDPVVSRVDFTDLPILTFAVADPTRSIEDLSYFVDDVIIRRLQAEPSIGHVGRIGGADRIIQISLHPERLAAIGITAAEVSRQLRASQVDLSAGRGDLGEQEFSIRALGAAGSIQALEAMPLSLPGGSSVRLADVGRVLDTHAEARDFAMLDGNSVIAFNVFRATGFSDVAAAEAAKAALDDLKADNSGIALTEIEDASIYTLGSYDAAIETLVEGAALAVIVVMIFLWNWRATIITAIALPLSIIPTFLVMNWLGFSLNTVSLLGITLVTGILVDDAIVEIENIVRHIRRGVAPYEAAREAASEIGTAVVAISLTIVAVFVPVSFMSGLAGQYFRQFGLTVAVAVLFSLLVARLVTPMLAAYFLTAESAEKEERDGRLMRGYLAILRWTLRNRLVTLVIGIAIFAASIYSATLLATTLVPNADEGRSNLAITLPPGSTLEETYFAAREITEKLQAIEEVASVFVQGGADGVNDASATIYYIPLKDRTRSASEIAAGLGPVLAGIPDVRMIVLNASNTQDLSVSVLGPSPEAAREGAEQLAEQMRGLDTLTNITSSAGFAKPEVRITPRPELAARLGISTQALAEAISVATLGDVQGNPARFSANGRQISIVVRLDETTRHNLDLLALQPLPTGDGGSIPLGAVAEIGLGSSPATINRFDRQSQVLVSADLAGGAALGPVMKQIEALPIASAMPAGTRLQTTGDAEAMQQVFTSFGMAMGVGLLLVYVILVLLFGSFMTPVTIVLSLPLSIGGAILALYATDNPISLPVLIGFLMLMGIVTKNAIMLVEFAVEGMRSGVEKSAAVMDAAHKRARPIVMTTIAMVAGMAPSALAFGTGGEFRAPMAIAVIGGLVVSTMLSLLFVPSLFSIIDGLRALLGRIFSRLLRFEHAAKSAPLAGSPTEPQP